MVNKLLAAYEKGDAKTLITILEKQALTSSSTVADSSFQKAYAQLKPLYNLSSPTPNLTKNSTTVIALNLLTLLASSESAQFHSTLESLPAKILNSTEVSWVRNIETGITEGSYTEVRNQLTHTPNKSFDQWGDLITDSIRTAIADCAESSYSSLPLTNLTTLLFLPSVKACESYAQQRGWSIHQSTVTFPSREEEVDIRAAPETLIQQTLGYARELESIV